MDGHFVPNLTIGPPVVEAIRKATNLPLDVHLMIEQPGALRRRVRPRRRRLHLGAPGGLPASARGRAGHPPPDVRPAVVINPATPLVAVEPILPDVDMLLIMSVNPGFGGQAFIEATLAKLTAARRLKRERGLRFPDRGGRRGEDAQLRCGRGRRGRGVRHRHRDLRDPRLPRHDRGHPPHCRRAGGRRLTCVSRGAFLVARESLPGRDERRRASAAGSGLQRRRVVLTTCPSITESGAAVGPVDTGCSSDW